MATWPAPPPSPSVALDEALADKNVQQEPVTAMLPPPPLTREMTDLIDLTVEPIAADPFDLSTIDFTTIEAPNKGQLDDCAQHGVAAAIVGGA